MTDQHDPYGVFRLLRESYMLLVEYGEESMMRPDSSGDHDGSAEPRQPWIRGGNYPYDKQVTYGQPADYDRGSSNKGPQHQPITPRDTKHTAWDEVDEAMGCPTNFTKSGSSQMGGTIPGAETGWANNPPKDWDEDDDPLEEKSATFKVGADDQISIVGKPQQFSTGLGGAHKGSRELCGLGVKEAEELLARESAWESIDF